MVPAYASAPAGAPPPRTAPSGPSSLRRCSPTPPGRSNARRRMSAVLGSRAPRHQPHARSHHRLRREVDKNGRASSLCRNAEGRHAEAQQGYCKEINFLHRHRLQERRSARRRPAQHVLRHIARLKFLPSTTVSSGNGPYAYWHLTELLDTQENGAHRGALRQLADIVAGDLAVARSVAMRLPDRITPRTANGKRSRSRRSILNAAMNSMTSRSG
jgi:hypothetical protein